MIFQHPTLRNKIRVKHTDTELISSLKLTGYKDVTPPASKRRKEINSMYKILGTVVRTRVNLEQVRRECTPKFLGILQSTELLTAINTLNGLQKCITLAMQPSPSQPRTSNKSKKEGGG